MLCHTSIIDPTVKRSSAPFLLGESGRNAAKKPRITAFALGNAEERHQKRKVSLAIFENRVIADENKIGRKHIIPKFLYEFE